MNIGIVREVWRYPVKSMQGERCDALELGEQGFAGDRRWAIVDQSSGKTLTAKTVPDLLFAAARTDGSAVVITLPDGTELDASDGSASRVIASWLGRDCALVPAAAASDTSYDMTFEPTNDEAELVSIPITPGTFFDLTPVHLITTTSLATMEAAHAAGVWDIRRFRPNIVVEVPADERPSVPAEPIAPNVAHPSFPEDGWVNHTVRFGAGAGAGDAAAVSVLMATVRCAMPNRAQPGLERDLDIFRTMNAHHGNHLGVYATPAGDGTVRVGDAVTLVTP